MTVLIKLKPCVTQSVTHGPGSPCNYLIYRGSQDRFHKNAYFYKTGVLGYSGVTNLVTRYRKISKKLVRGFGVEVKAEDEVKIVVISVSVWSIPFLWDQSKEIKCNLGPVP